MSKAPWIRKVIWRLPAGVQPKIEPEIWVVGFDPDSGDAVDGIRTTRPDFGAVTGVVESAGRVWMSTIDFPAVAYFDPPLARPSSPSVRQGGMPDRFTSLTAHVGEFWAGAKPQQ